jgi:hypothetical protein
MYLGTYVVTLKLMLYEKQTYVIYVCVYVT